jgi:hypothetical protein
MLWDKAEYGVETKQNVDRVVLQWLQEPSKPIF